MRPLRLALGVLVLAMAWTFRRELEAGAGAALDSAGAVTETITDTVNDIMSTLSGYSPDKVPEQYRARIAAAESANGIPAGMLARLLWQESRYRTDIISGAKRSPVGALGIAQFMPATAREWDVDPLNPESAIDGAGRYVAWLYRRTGTWPQALAAYNWGIGNVRNKGLAAAPTETRNYFTQILADLGIGGPYA